MKEKGIDHLENQEIGHQKRKNLHIPIYLDNINIWGQKEENLKGWISTPSSSPTNIIETLTPSGKPAKRKYSWFLQNKKSKKQVEELGNG